MARFYASIKGNRGPASRCGSVSSGIRGHIRGLDRGVEVNIFDRYGEDVIQIYLTGGSNDPFKRKLIHFSSRSLDAIDNAQ